MANNPGIAGDAKLHLQGIRAYVDPERGLVFVHNEKRDEWMLCCPHCSTVYWYVLGNNLMHIPEECRNAISPPMLCETCKREISYDRPWSDHDHTRHERCAICGVPWSHLAESKQAPVVELPSGSGVWHWGPGNSMFACDGCRPKVVGLPESWMVSADA